MGTQTSQNTSSLLMLCYPRHSFPRGAAPARSMPWRVPPLQGKQQAAPSPPGCPSQGSPLPGRGRAAHCPSQEHSSGCEGSSQPRTHHELPAEAPLPALSLGKSTCLKCKHQPQTRAGQALQASIPGAEGLCPATTGLFHPSWIRKGAVGGKKLLEQRGTETEQS